MNGDITSSQRLPVEIVQEAHLEQIEELGAVRNLLPAASTEAVDAERLEQDVEKAVAAIRVFATPEATRQSYASALRYWCAWHQLRLGRPLSPPTPTFVAKLFVLDHFGIPKTVGTGADAHVELHVTMPASVDAALVAQRYKAQLGRQKMTTIDHRLAVLAWLHRQNGLPSPLLNPELRQLLTDCRKSACWIGETPKQKTALRKEGLAALLATCDDSLQGLRDRALLLFGWASGGRRRSEIARAEVQDLEWQIENGERRALFRMRHSKTGDTSPKPIKGVAALALWNWIEAARIWEGPIFRRLHGPTIGARLSPHAVNEIIQRRAEQAGLDATQFGGHSLRRGFITEAANRAVPLAETMRLSGHRQVRTVVGYYEQAEVLNSPAADLLDVDSQI